MFKKFDIAAMDKAGKQAKAELFQKGATWDAPALSVWWKKWYLKAGHKRLGRALLELTNDKTKKESAPGMNEVGAVEQVSGIPVKKPVQAKKRAKPKTHNPLGNISSAVTLIRRAERTVLDDLTSGRVKEEQAITERLVGAIYEHFNDRTYAGILWSSLTGTARKGDAQHCADLLGSLHVGLKDYSIQMGFLARVKYLRSGERLATPEFDRLKQQCAKMLSHSSASFVFLCQKKDFSVLPAIAVASLDDAGKLAGLTRRPLSKFFQEHVNCFFGDQALYASNDETLNELRQKVNARHALLLVGKLKNQASQKGH